MSQAQRDSALIKCLREQVHKSFLQISQMEKLFHMEMQHAKEQFNQREQSIKQREQDIRLKYAQIENNLRSKQSFFLVDVGDFDLSLDEIAYKRDDTITDSGLQKIRQMLVSENRNLDRSPEVQMAKLQQIQTGTLNSIPNPPSILYQLFQISSQLCLDNCRLREQLLNCQQNNDAYRNQLLEAERITEMAKKNEKNLLKQNMHANELYFQEASRNAEVEEEIKWLHVQITRKNQEIEDLKDQVSKLSESLKSVNKIDMTKLNLKFPLPNKTKHLDVDVEKAPAVQQSRAATFSRNNSNTPVTQISLDGDCSPRRQFPNVEYGPKFFKRRSQVKQEQ